MFVGGRFSDEAALFVWMDLPPSPRFTASVSTNQTFARLPEGDFIARIYTSNLGYTVSPRLSFSNLIQYDNRSRNRCGISTPGNTKTITPGGIQRPRFRAVSTACQSIALTAI